MNFISNFVSGPRCSLPILLSCARLPLVDGVLNLPLSLSPGGLLHPARGPAPLLHSCQHPNIDLENKVIPSNDSDGEVPSYDQIADGRAGGMRPVKADALSCVETEWHICKPLCLNYTAHAPGASSGDSPEREGED